MPEQPRVVFLANDAVFQQGLAFLESFRAYNPSLRLSMIPYADDIDGLSKLQEVYEFDILSLDVGRWDDLAHRFFPGVAKKFVHRLRKLAIFDVEAPCTIYLDLDMVVLRDLSFLIEPITSGAADFICTATGNDPWVYKEIYKSISQLSNAKRFSDGFFVFNPSKFGRDRAFNIVVENEALYRAVRADQVYCQPVTNFVVDMLEVSVKEVYSLFPDISPQVWYAGEKLSLSGDRVISSDGKDVLFVHWAGPVDTSKDFRFKELFESYVERSRQRAGAAGVSSSLLS